ncbi:MAG TPA: acetyl-CoA carboxylase biotin carboxyl carrier protein [Nitrospira sp.]|nr:acetyl-CoA carboxylase biotin carboxyl carrier protein [Nitrospira sp.]
MSPGRRRRPRKRTTAIVLPQALADRPGDQGPPLLTGNQTKHIQELVDLLKRNNLTELELEREGVRIRVRYEVSAKTVVASTTEAPISTGLGGSPATGSQASPAAEQAGLVTITSPIVGTFYRSPSPDADPYVEEGDFVKKGQVLCIVEAMKLMNEIESEVNGRVVKILAESTKPVEYGQALFQVDPKATA